MELDSVESVLDLHLSQLRERHDPEEGHEPVPWWLWTVFVVGVFGSGFYLGRYSGSFDGPVRQVRFDEQPWSGTRPPAAPVAAATTSNGAAVYAGKCAACHQANGAGIQGAFPPLDGSEWVTGPDSLMVKIVLHGVQGPIEVKGTTYNGAMPAWGAVLSDAEIAAVVTHARSSWANHVPAVDSSTVARVRQSTKDRTTPWSADELRKTLPAP
jgi:mono/diheme cytochrome c family protein